MIVLNCFVRFTSTLDLQTVAAVLTGCLFGGVDFISTDEFDEVPGVRLERPVFGMSASICGGGPEYGLRVETVLPIFQQGAFPKIQFLDLNPYVEQLLASIREIQLIRT